MIETWEEKRRRWGYQPMSPVIAHGALTADRYPVPAEAELVTLWKRSGRVVLSITAGGQTQDFYMPPARLVYLIREVAEQLADNTLIQ